MRDGPLLSVVVPCFNEEEVIATTHRRLSAALSQLPGLDFEIVYVDDGSRDGTALILEGLAAADDAVRVVKLSRNFGHQIALTAGLEHASGDAVVVIDADLQDPPEVIPELVARWRDGNDIVYAVRTDREGESAFKLATAKGFYRILNKLSDTEVPVDTGDFRLMDRRAVDALLELRLQFAFSGSISSQASAAQIVTRKKRRNPSCPSRLKANGQGSQKVTGAS